MIIDQSDQKLSINSRSSMFGFSKSPKMKVSLKQFQNKLIISNPQLYKPMLVSSHIEWKENSAQQYPQNRQCKFIATENCFLGERKKIFNNGNQPSNRSRSKSPIVSSRNKTPERDSSPSYNIQSIHTFGRITNENQRPMPNYSNSSYQPFQEKYFCQNSSQLIPNENNKLSRQNQVDFLNSKYRGLDYPIVESKPSEEKSGTLSHSQSCCQIQLNTSAENCQLKRKLIEIQTEVKEIHLKLQQKGITEQTRLLQFEDMFQKRQKSFLNKNSGGQLKRNIQKLQEETRQSRINRTMDPTSASHFNSPARSPIKEKLISGLQLARSRRLELIAKENDRLLSGLMKAPETTYEDYPVLATSNESQRDYRQDYDSYIYSNEERLKMRLNSISALPKTKDEYESMDQRDFGDLLSPFAFNPNSYV